MIGLAIAVLFGLLIGFLRHGSIANLGHAKLHAVPLVFIGVLLQVGSTLAERQNLSWLPLALVLASFACVFAFASLNWRLSGMTLVGIGSLMNFVVISVNGGMPVSLDALAEAGLGNPFATGGVVKGAHHALTGSSRLTFLADKIPLRIGGNVVSVGDIVIWAGLLVIVQQLMVGRPGRRRRGAAEHELSAR